MKTNTRIIVIGIDGGTWNALKPFIARGFLPTFQKFMSKGAYGTLMSAIPCRSSTSIISFYTGKNPAKWGGLDFSCFDCDVMTYEEIRKRNPAIWEILGQHGLKSAVLNIPTTYPPTPVEGVMVSGFNPSEKDEYTYPKDFKKNIEGFHSERETFVKLISGKQIVETEDELLSLYLRSAKRRYELIRRVIGDKTFDFAAFWIDESDAAQHDFWGQDNYLLGILKEIDNQLKDLSEQNPDSDIIVMSDHGFDAVPVYEFYPKSWLKQEGYLKLKGSFIQQWLAQLANTIIISVPSNYRYKYVGFFYYLLNKLKNIFGVGLKKEENTSFRVDRNWRLKKHSSESRAIGVDWSKTVASNHDFWGIRIFKEIAGENYEQIRSEIIRKMRELKDRNGENIIKYVWKREEIFKGAGAEKFPDIAYLPTSKFLPTGFLPFSITRNRPVPHGVRVSKGGHMIIREGIFLAMGPHIKNAGGIGELNILDLAPTILSMFKVSVPEDADGRILKEIIQ